MATDKLKAVSKETQTIKMGSIVGPSFQVSFSALLNSSLSVQASHKILNLAEQVRGHQRRYEELRMGLLNRFAVKDPEGKPAMNEKKTEYLMADPEGFDSEYKNLLDIDIEVTKIPLSYLEGAQLSPNMLQTLLKTVVEA